MTNDIQRLSKPIVISGLLLLLLLPTGLFSGTSSLLFILIFIHHLAIQLWATAISVNVFLKVTSKSKFGYIFTTLFICIFTLIAIQTILPVTARDALIHHLAIPKLWLEHGRILEIPWHEWSYYPMLIQLGYTGLMSLGLTQLSALYHFSFLLQLCAVTSLFISSRFDSSRYAIWAYLLPLFTPLLFRLAGEPLVDLPLALYFGLAFVLLIKSFEDNFSGQDILMAGLALGLALCTKYNAIPGVFFFLLTFIYYGVRKKVSLISLTKIVLTLTILSLLLFSPWLIKNYVWVKTPIYPFLKVSNVDSSTKVNVLAKLSPLEQRHYLYDEGVADLILIPFRMFISGEDGNPAQFDGVLSPILLIFIIGMIAARKEPWVMWSFLYCSGYFIFSILTASARTRYMTPLALPVFAMAIYGFVYLHRSKYAILKYGAKILFGVHILYGFLYAHKQLVKYSGYTYVFSDISVQDYLNRYLIEYPVIQFVNTELIKTPIPKVYLLGTGNRFYYYSVDVVGGHYSTKLINNIILNNNDPAQVLAELRKEGVTHLLVHKERVDRSLSATLPDGKLALWNTFRAQSLKEIFSVNGYSVYEIY